VRQEQITGKIDEEAMIAVAKNALDMRGYQVDPSSNPASQSDEMEEVLYTLMGLSPSQWRRPTSDEEENNSLPSLVEASFSSLMTDNTTVTMQTVVTLMAEKNLVIQRAGKYVSFDFNIDPIEPCKSHNSPFP